MSLPTPHTRTPDEPRLDVHNANIDQDSAAAGECGTVDLANGWKCRQPALHRDGCTFEAPADSPRT
jgi:hypothetical protein